MAAPSASSTRSSSSSTVTLPSAAFRTNRASTIRITPRSTRSSIAGRRSPRSRSPGKPRTTTSIGPSATALPSRIGTSTCLTHRGGVGRCLPHPFRMRCHFRPPVAR